jgi:hypothetical protein
MNQPPLMATLAAGSGESRYPLAWPLTADEQRYRALLTNATLVERHVHTHEERWWRLYATRRGDRGGLRRVAPLSARGRLRTS